MAHSIKVLIVENDTPYAQLLAEVLVSSKEYTFDVDRATTSAMAMERLSSAAFEVVLLDLTLPDTSQHSALEIFSKIVAISGQTPIIVVSSSNNDTLAVDLINQGAQAYLVKGDLNSSMIAPLVASAVDGYHLLAEVNAQAKKLSEAECRKRLPEQWDKLTQSIFSVNMIGSSLPHLWRCNPHEAQQGLSTLHSIAQDTLRKINGLLDEGFIQ